MGIHRAIVTQQLIQFTFAIGACGWSVITALTTGTTVTTMPTVVRVSAIGIMVTTVVMAAVAATATRPLLQQPALLVSQYTQIKQVVTPVLWISYVGLVMCVVNATIMFCRDAALECTTTSASRGDTSTDGIDVGTMACYETPRVIFKVSQLTTVAISLVYAAVVIIHSTQPQTGTNV